MRTLISVTLLTVIVCVYGNPLQKQENARLQESIEALPGQFFYQVGIYTNTQYHCMGSLISENWVLTSAYCVLGYKHTLNIRFGAINYELAHHDPDTLEISSREFITHPDYIDLQNGNLALMKLDYPVPTHTARYSPISLPSKGEVLIEGQEVLVSGLWYNENVENTLHYGNTTLMTERACKDYYGNVITDKCVCTDANKNASPCVTDTGAPLVVYIGHIPRLAAVVGKAGCGLQPTTYTRVEKYLDWIEQISGVTL